MLQSSHVFLETCAHYFYFASDESQVGIWTTYKAEYQTVNWLRYIELTVMLDEKRLQLIFIEGFTSKFYVLVADVGEDSSLWMQIIIASCFSYNAAFNVAEQYNTVDLRAKTFA